MSEVCPVSIGSRRE